MKEHPILFSDEMVQAILEGRKTQTRRVIKIQPIITESGVWYPNNVLEDNRNRHYANEHHLRKSLAFDFQPYGQPGDRLWVKENFQIKHFAGFILAKRNSLPKHRPADDSLWNLYYRASDPEPCDWWRSSLFMPHWASRIDLEIINVQVQRVQEISIEDAIKEGMTIDLPFCDQRNEFEDLWNDINKKRGFGWNVNPWVWVIEFRRIKEDE